MSKRELWTKLLTTTLGTNFHGEDDLFDLFVVMAEIIGHAVVGIDPADPTISPATVLSGRLLADAQIGGVIEADFFDWPAEVPGGEALLRTPGAAAHPVRVAARRERRDEGALRVGDRRRGAPPARGGITPPDWLAALIVGPGLVREFRS